MIASGEGRPLTCDYTSARPVATELREPSAEVQKLATQQMGHGAPVPRETADMSASLTMVSGSSTTVREALTAVSWFSTTVRGSSTTVREPSPW